MTNACDFDQEIDRSHTASLKYDGRATMFGADGVIPLWVADMDFAAPRGVTQALAERAAHPVYGYTVYPDSLYQALTKWLKCRHGWEVQRDWIMMCPGVVPSLHATVLALVQPESAVIVQPPVYFPFFSAVTSTGRQLAENPLRIRNRRYCIDFDHLEQCAEKASLLLLCSPHNPVGRVWTREELGRLFQIAQKHGTTIFSDEIHADLVYPGNRHHVLSMLTEAAQGDASRVITAIAPSKTFNIPGLNLSVLVVPNPEYRKSLGKIFDTMHVSASNPFSIVAFEAAYRQGGAWLDDLLVYLAKTRDFVAEYLVKHIPEIRLVEPEGTYLLWLDCHLLMKSLGMNDMQLRQFFVHKAAVGMSPGTLFGNEGSGFMRMNIGAPRHVVRMALENIREAIHRMRNESVPS